MSRGASHVFTWPDGDDVIAVPKAGQESEVEAQVVVDLSTARMHEYIRAPDSKAACESDRLFVDAYDTEHRMVSTATGSP